MPRKGENIYKRKDGKWEGRYVKGRNGKKAIYGYEDGFLFLTGRKKSVIVLEDGNNIYPEKLEQ